MTSIATPTSEYRTDHRGLRAARSLRARQARAHRSRRQGFLQGQVSNDVEVAGAGDRLLRRVLDAQGQDARRPPDPRRRRGAAAGHRARRAPGAVQHDPALQHRLRRRAAQAHARARAAVAGRPRGVALAGASTLAGDEHAHAPVTSAAWPPERSAPTSASICCARAPTPRRCATRSSGPAPRGRRRRRRVPAGRARPPALRDRSRRLGDPAGGGLERSRGVVHQGLLRRAGDGGAAALPRQAQPSSARTEVRRRRSRPAIS